MEYLLCDTRSFKECKGDKTKTLYFDQIIDGYRCLVMRGPASLCAYIGVPEGHFLYGIDYNQMPSVDCHGGLTFSGPGDDDYRPAGWWYFGWDYAHVGDACFYDFGFGWEEHDWTVEDVIYDVKDAIEQFKRIKMVESTIVKFDFEET